MATPWWARISPDYYKKSSGLNEAVAPRLRSMRAVLADTNLADEPQIAGAFMRTGVPVSLAQRANMEYTRVKAEHVAQVAAQVKMTDMLTKQQEAARASEPTFLERFLSWGEEKPRDPNAPEPSVITDIQDFGKGLATGALETANAAFSPLMVPMSIIRANENPEDLKIAEEWKAGAIRRNEEEREGWGGEGPQSFPVDIQNWGAHVGSTAIPLLRGLGRYIGSVPLTEGQQKDMRSQGYDPESFTSRYAWYYSGMDAGQRAIADSDVEQFSQEFDPGKVQLTREILTSNALNDGNISALSPEAQNFVASVTSDSGDPRDKELFERMSKSSTLYMGSTVADAFGMPRGSTQAMWTSALSDLALFWYLDPVAGGVNIARSLNVGKGAFTAGHIAAAENMLRAVSVPGDITSAAATSAGRRFNELLETAEKLKGFADNAAADPAQAAKIDQAASQLFEQFRIKHPDMVNHLDIVSRMRLGQLDRVAVKDPIAAEKALIDQGKTGKKLDPFVYVPPMQPGQAPVWELVRGADGKFTNESLNIARNKVVDRMTEYIWHEALATGQPLHRGIALLPGQVALNRHVRAALVPIRDALTGSNHTLGQVLNNPRLTAPVSFGGQIPRTTDLYLSSAAGDVTRAVYTEKWGPTLEKIVSRIDNSYSGKPIVFTGAESTEMYRRFVTSMFPKHMANAMAVRWAQSGPGARMAQWRQTVEAFTAAAHFKTDPIAREVTDFLTKGVVPSTQRGVRHGPNEVYTANRADNVMEADGHEIAAAVWPYQLADGVTLPNFRAIRTLQEKVGFLSAVTGLFHTRLVNNATAIWKVGKVGNPANMARQAAELGAMGGLEQGLRHTYNVLRARRWAVGETVAARAARNDLDRAVAKINKDANQTDHAWLNDLAKAGDWTGLRNELVRLGQAAGATSHEARALANLAEGVAFNDLVQTARLGKTALIFAGPIDAVRRVRAEYLKRALGSNPVLDTPWQQYLDEAALEGFTKAAIGEFGANANDALLLTRGTAADDLANAADKAVNGVPARVPNSREWMGAQGDAGARNWFNEFDSRQTDLLGNEILRAVAIEARNAGTATTAQILNQGFNRTRRGLSPFTPAPVYPPGVDTAEDIARYLIGQHEYGLKFRELGMRLQYTATGKQVNGPIEIQEAVDRLALIQLRDAARHLGAEFRGNGAIPVWKPEYNKMLDKLARGYRVKIDDLQLIPDRFRPRSISTSLYVPAVGRPVKPDRIVDMASKLYNFTVAAPLQRLAITPEFIANRNVAYRALEPAAAELMARGNTPIQAAMLLESAASRYAVKSTFRYTDEATEHSFFSELADNFLMFQRASEDFVKRFMTVSKANPAIVSKAYLLMEAGQHSGMIYPQTMRNDEGNEETHLVFTFPGSGLAARAIQEAGTALGWGASDLVAQAVYSSMSSQVRYINPSLVNPLGFSTSPMIGLPMRITRSLYPETYSPITDVLQVTEGGGERFFAEQDWFQSLMPTPIGRILPAITQNTRDSQLASAIKNAMIYQMAAGVLPGPDAGPDEIQEAHDAIREQATNQLVWRAVVGAISPWVPQYNEPELDGKLPDVNPLDMARGINNIRGEWFDVLQTASTRYGPDAAFGAAMTEWARRHPKGLSILNPEVFQVGTSTAPGTATNSGSAFSGPQVTDWMMSNRDWIKDNNAVAYYLLPAFQEAQYSSAGMRTQLNNGLRVKKDSEEFYRDLRQQVGEREWWDQKKARDALLATGGNPNKVWRDWNAFEKGWQTANPATHARMQEKNNPGYIHGTLAPALQKLVESGNAPQGVDLAMAKAVWDHYSAYREKYNSVGNTSQAVWDQRKANSRYRTEGDRMFLGTPVEDLWRAMDVYESGS